MIERRKGKDKPVIRKALVELLDDPNHKSLNNSPFYAWKMLRDLCQIYDLYQIAGPMQFSSQSFDIPFMLRIELEGCAHILSRLVKQVLGTTLDVDFSHGEEKYFTDLLELCKSQFGNALDEKHFNIKWPAEDEHFTFVGGTRPKSALEIALGDKGYNVPTESFGFLEGDVRGQFFSPAVLESVQCIEDETTQCMDPKDEPFVSKALAEIGMATP